MNTPGAVARAIQGKGAFRRFKDELHEEYPDLLPAWYVFRDARARRRAWNGWLIAPSLTVAQRTVSCPGTRMPPCPELANAVTSALF